MITKFTEHSDRVVSVAFSPDNYLIASASYDETVRIWNPKTGKQLHIFSVKPTIGAYEDEYKFTIDSSSKVAFSSEGQALSIVNGYNTIATFEINSGKIFKKSYGRASYGGATALDVNSELFASALPWGGSNYGILKKENELLLFRKLDL